MRLRIPFIKETWIADGRAGWRSTSTRNGVA